MSLTFIDFAPRDGVIEFSDRWSSVFKSSLPKYSYYRGYVQRKSKGFQFFLLLTIADETFFVERFIANSSCNGKRRDWQKDVYEELLCKLSDIVPERKTLKPARVNTAWISEDDE